MYILGIDYGTQKLGLALLESTTEIISPLPPLKVTKELFNDINKVVSSYNVQTFVIGVPNNSKMLEKIKSFSKKITEKYGKPIYFVGEDFSSKEAQSMLLSLRKSHSIRINKYGQKDSMSALIILEDWLNQNTQVTAE